MNAQAANLVSAFVEQVDRKPDANAVWYPDGKAFQAWTWGQLSDRVTSVAAGLVQAGVEPGDRVVLLSENRWEWLVVDLAIQMARAVHVPVHAPLTASQIAFQVEDSGARVVLASTSEQAEKLQSCGPDFCHSRACFALDADVPENFSTFRSWESLWSQDANLKAEVQQSALDSLSRASLATMLYTSGTTGDPKGVMLSQENLYTNAAATLEAFGQQPDDVRLNFLPLSHVFARVCDLYTWLIGGIQLAIATSKETVIAECAEIHPTILNGVPYFYDKVRRVLIEKGVADAEGALQHVFGGRMRFLCSGGAALPDHVFDFYQQRGLPILQGYGMTEASPVISVSSRKHVRRGASGKAIPDVEIRIADDGEILTRGPHVMVGYYGRPDATAEIVKEGWLHTGDLGRLDEDGFLYITGRKKEMIVTSGGKNVSPVDLEAMLTEDPLILQALVIGDGRNFLTALIVPDREQLCGVLDESMVAEQPWNELLECDEVCALFKTRIARCMENVSHYEQIARYQLLAEAFSIESGEMTPKMSLRRKVIEERYREAIAHMYGESV